MFTDTDIKIKKKSRLKSWKIGGKSRKADDAL